MDESKLLKKIFSRKGLSSTYRAYKMRYRNGTLSGKKIDFILKSEGYFKEKEATWLPLKPLPTE